MAPQRTEAEEDDRVVVWLMPVAAPAGTVLDRWCRLLDAEERARADRFRHPPSCLLYLAAHALARIALGDWLGEPPDSLRFRRPEGGKPELAGRSGPSFSLSHCPGLVACAVSALPVGVDAESLERANDVEAIAAQFFAPSERELVFRLGRPGFLRLWTLKEARLKAGGEGLRRRLDSVPFSLDPVAYGGADSGQWRFAQWWSGPGHVVAVAQCSTGPGPLVPRLRVLADGDF